MSKQMIRTSRGYIARDGAVHCTQRQAERADAEIKWTPSIRHLIAALLCSEGKHVESGWIDCIERLPGSIDGEFTCRVGTVVYSFYAFDGRYHLRK